MSLNLKCYSNKNVTQIGMQLKLEYHSNWKITQIEMSLKLKCHSNWKNYYIEKVVSPKTLNSASIGQISILFLWVPLYSHDLQILKKVKGLGRSYQ